jgi:general stress protein YciG
MKTRPLTVSEAGRIGGMTTFERYGQEFMAEIAKKGAKLRKKTKRQSSKR